MWNYGALSEISVMFLFKHRVILCFSCSIHFCTISDIMLCSILLALTLVRVGVECPQLSWLQVHEPLKFGRAWMLELSLAVFAESAGFGG